MQDVNNTPESSEKIGENPMENVDNEETTLPGSKTPPELLLKSLQEEREARRELENRIALLESSSSSDVFSDEGKALQSKISTLETELLSIKQREAKNELLIAHPELKEVWSDFESFRADPENKGMNLKTSAKAFLIEKGFSDPERKGLEKTTGGQRIPISQAPSPEEIKTLRESDPRKYREMLLRGEIKV